MEVQPLAQVTPTSEWPKLRSYWSRRIPAGTGAWPAHIEPGSFALNLWPIAPGRVGRAAGLGADVFARQPKMLLCTPGLSVFDPHTGSDVHTVLAVLVATWLTDVGMEVPALRLAPPVLECWAPGGRLLSREVATFGLKWQLPPPDGV